MMNIPVLGFSGPSGVGKTTLLTNLIPLLRYKGLRVGLIKHSHHNFDIDVPGKDSYTLREAGANPVLIGSRHRWALMKETPELVEPRLRDLVAHFHRDTVDLILVEGFKQEQFPKIVLQRGNISEPYSGDPSVIAIAIADGKAGAPDYETILRPSELPILDLNQPKQIAAFILDNLDRFRKDF